MSLPIRRRPPKEILVPFTDPPNQPVVLKPLSAEGVGKIEERFPWDHEENCRPNSYAYHAALVAATCFEQKGTKEHPVAGDQAFSETDLRGVDSFDFWALWEEVRAYCTTQHNRPDEDAPKN